MLASQNGSPASSDDKSFAVTREKCNIEMAEGKVKGTNFPYDKVRNLPGYPGRDKPGLAAVDVTNELARYLMEYSERKGAPLPYGRRDISHYLWMQASRRMVAWDDILNVVRAARKTDRVKPISHYFGYRYMVEQKGTARDKKLIKFVRYVLQEGECAGCGDEFGFHELTLDRIKPGKAAGKYELPNVQLMCQPCNNRKADSCGDSSLNA